MGTAPQTMNQPLMEPNAEIKRLHITNTKAYLELIWISRIIKSLSWFILIIFFCLFIFLSPVFSFLLWLIPQWCMHGRCVSIKNKPGYQDVDGNWGAWKPWSDCYPQCGQGLSTRERACDNPAWVTWSHLGLIWEKIAIIIKDFYNLI